MFEDGDVEGRFMDDVVKERGIRCQVDKGVDVDMETTLTWAVETVMRELEKLAVKFKASHAS